MRRVVLGGLAVAGAAVLARRVAGRCGGVDFAKLVERMPEDAPPKWMFRNIGAIRENTERILELLDAERAPSRGGREATVA